MSKNKAIELCDYFTHLSKDFPKEAYSEDKSRGFSLTSIKSQYVVERLNQVFGIFGWKASYSVVESTADNLAMKCELFVTDITTGVETVRIAFGGAQKRMGKKQRGIGDVYKSAQTDALTKAASHIGIGNSAFKGNINPAEPDPEEYTESGKPLADNSQVAQFLQFCGRLVKIGVFDKDSMRKWFQENVMCKPEELKGTMTVDDYHIYLSALRQIKREYDDRSTEL